MTRLGAAAIAMLVCAGPSAASAQPVCGPREDLVTLLAREHGETLAFAGRHPSAPLVMELFVNGATGSWTIVQSKPDTSCMTAAGRDGRVVPPGEGV